MNSCDNNENDSIMLSRHEQTIDLIPAQDANNTLIFDYEV